MPGYDPECYKLAEYFMQDEPELKADLAFVASVAQEIQTCIEQSIELRRAEIAQEKLDPPEAGEEWFKKAQLKEPK